MPKRVIRYVCQYACGHKAIASKKQMELHESSCFWNPERRACMSCKHFFSGWDSNGMEHEPHNLETWRYRECKAFVDISEKLMCDCPKHKGK